MSECIEQVGTIVAVSEKTLKVKIAVASACGACRGKDTCFLGQGKEKVIEAIRPFSRAFRVGDSVTVQMEGALGYRAVGIAYGLPFVIFMVFLVLGSFLGYSELSLGIIALGAVGIYYLVLYRFRNRLDKQFRFEIKS